MNGGLLPAGNVLPPRPDKLAPLERQPSLPGGVAHVQGFGNEFGSSLGAVGGVHTSGESSGSGKRGSSAGAVKAGGCDGEGQQGLSGELQAELERLRREVKQLRIENKNVYWLDDECKRLRAELEAAPPRKKK